MFEDDILNIAVPSEKKKVIFLIILTKQILWIWIGNGMHDTAENKISLVNYVALLHANVLSIHKYITS